MKKLVRGYFYSEWIFVMLNPNLFQPVPDKPHNWTGRYDHPNSNGFPTRQSEYFGRRGLHTGVVAYAQFKTAFGFEPIRGGLTPLD